MSYDRDSERRRDEARRRSEEEGRRINRELTDKITKADIAGKRAADRAAQLNREIERREWAERLNDYRKWMDDEKASTLKQVSTCREISAATKDRWYQHLDNVDLTSPSAGTELKNLVAEVEREKRLWSDEPFHLPDKSSPFHEWLKSRYGLQNLLSPAERWLLQKHESTEGRASLNPVELRLRQREEDRAMERKLKENALALIVSSLASLMSSKNLYESTLSKLDSPNCEKWMSYISTFTQQFPYSKCILTLFHLARIYAGNGNTNPNFTCEGLGSSISPTVKTSRATASVR
jgi:hypothetical protein